MKKVLAGLFVTAVAALVSMGFASTAQAYPSAPLRARPDALHDDDHHRRALW